MNSSIVLYLKRWFHSTPLPLRECSSVPPPIEPVVTILNAASEVGKNLALLLKQNPNIGELRLYDKTNICAIAEDLSHIDTKAKIKSFIGLPVLKSAITDADLVVTVGGERETPEETFETTFNRNSDDVRIYALNMAEFNPKGIFCIARPPVEALVPLVSEEYKKAGVYDWKKIFGVTNAASMRANSIVAGINKHRALEVVCPIVGGLTGDCLVAVLSQVRPQGETLSGLVQKQILNAENEVLKLYNDRGGMYLLPALGASRLIGTILKALNGDSDCVECAFVRQTSHIGNYLPYMTSIVRLGRHGVSSTHMPKVNGEEGHLLQKASVRIKEYIRHGESSVTGEPQTAKEKILDTQEIPTNKYLNVQKPEPTIIKANTTP